MTFAITVARKPVVGSVARNTLAHGTGGLNIGKCRLAYEEGFVPPKDANVDKPSAWTGEDYNGSKPYILNAKLKQRIVYVPEGRFPANAIWQHNTSCVQVGTRKVKSGTAFQDNKTTPNRIYQGEWAVNGVQGTAGYASEDGLEEVPAWDCSSGCPVAELDQQTEGSPRFFKQVQPDPTRRER